MMPKKNCENCDGMCCKYVSIEIDIPEELDDFEDIKWYVAHKNVNVYVNDDDEWYVEFLTPCEFLGEDNLCRNYEKRPKICGDYDAKYCLHHNKDYTEKYTFKNISDVEKYIEEVFNAGEHIILEYEDEE